MEKWNPIQLASSFLLAAREHPGLALGIAALILLRPLLIDLLRKLLLPLAEAAGTRLAGRVRPRRGRPVRRRLGPKR